MSSRHDWGWQPPQTASCIHIRHLQSVWAHWYDVHMHKVEALHSYTHPPSNWNATQYFTINLKRYCSPLSAVGGCDWFLSNKVTNDKAWINMKPRECIKIYQIDVVVISYYIINSGYDYFVLLDYLLKVLCRLGSSVFGIKSYHSRVSIIMLTELSHWNIKQALYNVIKNTITGITWYNPLQAFR